MRLQQEFDLSLLFISHDLSVVRHISHRIMVLYLGRVMEIADRGPERFDQPGVALDQQRSEEHTSELQSLMRISYAVFCLTKKTKRNIQYPEARKTNLDH